MFLNYLLIFPIVVYYFCGFVYLVLSGQTVSFLFLPIVVGVLLATFPFLRSQAIEVRRLRNFEVLVLLFLQFVVIVSLLNIDISTLRLTGSVVREESFWQRLLIVHLLLSWMASLQLTGYVTVKSKMFSLLSVMIIVQSVAIGFLEGRRTAAVLPFVFLFFLALGKGGMSARKLLKAAAIGGALVAFFVIVTTVRTGSDFVANMLFSRLFWPAIALNDVLLLRPDFDPGTIVQVLSRLADSVGAEQYLSTTNAFGRYMGYVSPDNYVIGINYGVIGEAVLAGGIVAPVLLQLILLLLLTAGMAIARDAPFNLAMLLPFLYVHGFQMEIPYSIVVLLKASIVFAIVAALIHILPKKEESVEVSNNGHVVPTLAGG